MKINQFILIGLLFILPTIANAKNIKNMKEIKTEIVIQATKEEVWKVLMDFSTYSEWNPFISSIKGTPEANTKLIAVLNLEGQKPMTIKPNVEVADKNKRFEWFGTMPLGMFNGRHYFQIEELGNGMVKFTQGEYFTGWFVKPLLKMVGLKTQNGFINMNKALKERVKK